VALADGRKLKAKVVGSDPEIDIAVLQVEGVPLPAIVFGDTDALRVGDVVLAIGNPYGFGQTVTMGIVSALGRSHLGINTFENFIQTDAAINPATRRGAHRLRGNLVGINAAIYSERTRDRSASVCYTRVERQAGHGTNHPDGQRHAWMDRCPGAGNHSGMVRIPATGHPERGTDREVLRGGPAERAGLKAGDILIAIEGKPVTDPNEMLNLVAALVPGKPASIRLRRDNKDVDLKVAVAGGRPRNGVSPKELFLGGTLAYFCPVSVL